MTDQRVSHTTYRSRWLRGWLRGFKVAEIRYKLLGLLGQKAVVLAPGELFLRVSKLLFELGQASRCFDGTATTQPVAKPCAGGALLRIDYLRRACAGPGSLRCYR